MTEALTEAEGQFLKTAAVLGPEFALADVARLVRQPAATLLAVAESLLAAGHITIVGEDFAFRDLAFWHKVIVSIPRPLRRMLSEEARGLEGAGYAPGSTAPRASLSQPMAVVSTVRLSSLLWAEGSPAEALEAAHAAVNEISVHTSPTSRLSARIALACKLTCLRDLAQADAIIETASQEAAEAGTADQLAAIEAARAFLLVAKGETSAARADAGHALRRLKRAAVPADWGQVARAVLVVTALRSGDQAAAQVQARQLYPQAATGGMFPRTYLQWVSFLTASAGCAAAESLDIMALRFPELDGRVAWYEEPVVAPWLIRLALDAGDSRLAADIADRVSQLAMEVPQLPVVAGTAAYARALVASDPEELERVALTHHDPWSAALCAEDLALRLSGGADKSRAGHWLISSLRSYETLNMRQDAARVREKLKWQGCPPGPGPGTYTRWEDLSQSERKIARLVAEGLTNRQIAEQMHVSPHTVNYYLRRMFQKLGIKSRVQVVRLLPSAPLPSSPLAPRPGASG